jgi:hypothetical protein
MRLPNHIILNLRSTDAATYKGAVMQTPLASTKIKTTIKVKSKEKLDTQVKLNLKVKSVRYRGSYAQLKQLLQRIRLKKHEKRLRRALQLPWTVRRLSTLTSVFGWVTQQERLEPLFFSNEVLISCIRVIPRLDINTSEPRHRHYVKEMVGACAYVLRTLPSAHLLRKEWLYTKLKYSRSPAYDIVSGGIAALLAGLLGFLVTEKFGFEMLDSGDFYYALMYLIFLGFSIRPLIFMLTASKVDDNRGLYTLFNLIFFYTDCFIFVLQIFKK